MSHPPSEHLSLYIDNDLGRRKRSEVDAHLARCETCRTLVADLSVLKDRLGALDDRPPERTLWPALAGRLTLRDEPGRRTDAERAPAGLRSRQILTQRARQPFFAGRLLAAAATLAVMGGIAWLLVDSRSPSAVDRRAATPARSVYDDANDALRAVVGSDHASTADEPLPALRQAIDSTRQALARHQGDAFLEAHLGDLERQRWRLLRSRAVWAGATDEGGSS